MRVHINIRVRCTDQTCKYHFAGHCSAEELEIRDQECATYRYEDESVYEQEDE